MTFDPRGPVAALTTQGHLIPAWGKSEAVTFPEGEPRYTYRVDYLNTAAILDLARLLVDGWVARIDPKHGGITIIIRRAP